MYVYVYVSVCVCVYVCVCIYIYTYNTYIYLYGTFRGLQLPFPEIMMKDCGSMKPTGSGRHCSTIIASVLRDEDSGVWPQSYHLAVQFLKKPSLDPDQIQIEKIAPTTRRSALAPADHSEICPQPPSPGYTQVRFTTLTMKSSTGRTLLSPFFALPMLNAVG